MQPEDSTSGAVAPVVVVHHPEPIAEGDGGQVVVVRFLEVGGLLKQRALALPAELPAVALRRREVLPGALVQPRVHGVVLPVAVLAHEAGPVLLAAAAAVLPRVEEDVVARHPPGGEALVAGILLVRDGVGPGHELRRHRRLVERHLPEHDAGVVAVPADQVAAVAVLQLDERRGPG